MVLIFSLKEKFLVVQRHSAEYVDVFKGYARPLVRMFNWSERVTKAALVADIARALVVAYVFGISCFSFCRHWVRKRNMHVLAEIGYAKTAFWSTRRDQLVAGFSVVPQDWLLELCF